MNNISDILVDWYLKNKRDLPWRDISDPYLIWISEIILQQTRVNQGTNYYLRFVERFPTLEALAQSTEDEVLKYWQGLGYYSRARNIHKAAKQIASIHKGVFPTKHADVLHLAGIGEYTAAAICSFAYNQAYAVVDGNVYRVLSRLFSIETPIDSNNGVKLFRNIAADTLNKKYPAIHNQAIMEFGALQCTPGIPNCYNCPLTDMCKAFIENKIDVLPVKSKKTAIKKRFFNYFFVEYEKYTFLKKRNSNDIWKNLFEFPLIETDRNLTIEELFNNVEFNNLFIDIDDLQIKKESKIFIHKLTHRHIYAKFYRIEISSKNKEFDNLIQVEMNKIDNFATSRLIEMYLENIND